MITKAKPYSAAAVITRIIDNQFRGKSSKFAEALGVRPNTVSGWTHGSPPKRETIERISEMYGVPIEDFYRVPHEEPVAQLPEARVRLSAAEAENKVLREEVEALRALNDRLLTLLEVQQSNQAGRERREKGDSKGRRAMPHNV